MAIPTTAITEQKRTNNLAAVSDDLQLFDSDKLDQILRLSDVMADMSILPDHLKIDSKTKAALSRNQIRANLFRIVNQALRWGFDPFSIIDETYMVAGKLGYQGKLIAAVVNTRAGLVDRLHYEFNDKAGDDKVIIVSGTFAATNITEKLAVRLGDVKTTNDMWKKDPNQKLVYTGSIKWARRYCPEVILGVMTDDDLDAIAASSARVVRPAPASLQDLTQHIATMQQQLESTDHFDETIAESIAGEEETR